MPAPIETCDTCRFDGSDYDVRDALGTLRAVTPMWQQTIEGRPDEVLLAPPPDGGWSAIEHAAHSARVAGLVGDLLGAALAAGTARVEAPQATPPDVEGGPSAVIARLDAAVRLVHDQAAALDGDDDSRWARTVTVGGDDLSAAWLLRHAVHDATHHLSDAGRALHAVGAGAPSQRGAVAQLNVSGGGVPKRPVDSVEVDGRGVVGDVQAARQHHGRPLQALCLWSSEVIEALQAEGHPIGAGFAGENVTIRGIDWPTIRPGVRLRVGTVLAEVSAYATPCNKNAGWFVGRDVNRMLHDTHPGWSRVYAWVRRPGAIATGDEVVVEP